MKLVSRDCELRCKSGVGREGCGAEIFHKTEESLDQWSSQGMEKKEDRPLQVVCCMTGDDTSKLELENENESKIHLGTCLIGQRVSWERPPWVDPHKNAELK